MRIRFLLTSLLVATAVLASGCGGGGDQSFSTPTYPFSFDYPSGWTLTRGTSFSYGSGESALRSVSVALKEPYDQVTLTQYKLKKKLPEGENGFQPEVDRIVARLVKQAKGKASRAKVVEFGGAPGFKYEIEDPGGNGATLKNKMTFLFKDQFEYQVGCQSSEENRKELLAGCDQVLETLKFN